MSPTFPAVHSMPKERKIALYTGPHSFTGESHCSSWMSDSFFFFHELDVGACCNYGIHCCSDECVTRFIESLILFA